MSNNLCNRKIVYLELLNILERKINEYKKNNKKITTNLCNFSNEDYIEIYNQYNININILKRYTVSVNNFYVKQVNNITVYKQLLNDNLLNDKIFDTENKISPDQELLNINGSIKIKLIGFSYYEQLKEIIHSNIKFDLHKFMYCLEDYNDMSSNLYCGCYCYIFFEVIENNCDFKYIFYSNYKSQFYKTNILPKIDYIPIANHVLYIKRYYYSETNMPYFQFEHVQLFFPLHYRCINYKIDINSRYSKICPKDIEDNYRKNILIKHAKY
ncbi:hypothetical protein Hokovirus_2_55 [Hokovirus HKV1]|uniref:Uncharacterized protein n=1 Tax=Hokovirus HKV1 TaxID=1977638 RepID=A0A1V0SFX2_9VIRU|nr:hypothetical protein Hokovirus_2_55 [Hokovirus HKV1]